MLFYLDFPSPLVVLDPIVKCVHVMLDITNNTYEKPIYILIKIIVKLQKSCFFRKRDKPKQKQKFISLSTSTECWTCGPHSLEIEIVCQKLKFGKISFSMVVFGMELSSVSV